VANLEIVAQNTDEDIERHRLDRELEYVKCGRCKKPAKMEIVDGGVIFRCSCQSHK